MEIIRGSNSSSKFIT